MASTDAERVAAWRPDPPFVRPETVRITEDVVFASPGGHDLALDLFEPTQRAGRWGPAVVYVHGGGWRGGSRRAFWRQAAHLADRGWLGVAVTYRFTPAYHFPAQLEDVQAAVRWLRARGEELGIDPGRVAAAGASSGGHLAALLGTTDAVVGGISSRVQAVVAFNGIFDFPTYDSEKGVTAIQALLGDDPEMLIAASPLRLVDAHAAPTLLLHGTADQTAPFAQSLAYQKRLRECGVRAELHAADGAPHNFWHRPPHYQATLESMTRFLESVC